MMTIVTTAVLSCTLAAAVAWAQPQPPAPQPPQPPAPPVAVWNRQQSGSYLGVGVVDVNGEVAERLGMSRPHGVEIARVADGSAARKAGLKKGDVIVRFRDQEIEGVEQFARLVRETPAGRLAPVTVLSDAGERSITVEMGARRGGPGGVDQDFIRKQVEQSFRGAMSRMSMDIPRPVMVTRNRSLGATLESLDGQLASFFSVEHGVLVRAVDDGSPAAEAGLRAGDVMVKIGGESVRRPNEVRRELSRAAGESAQVEIVRSSHKKTLAVETKRMSASRPRPVRARSVASEKF